MPNLDFKGAVPYHTVNSYFEAARLFINTSESEGFPNSFLQAWVRRVPVISFFDPDNLIEELGLGASPGDLPGMVEAIRNVLNDDARRAQIGERARDFVKSRYSSVAVARKYEEHVLVP